MNDRFCGLRLSLAAALGFSFAMSANAQVAGSAPAADAGGVEEIVVTARRIEERAQDIPISMTVFSQQQLTDRNITSSSDLAAYTPSLSTDNEFGTDVTSFSIRGAVQAVNTTPSVAVYFADAVVPRGGNAGETVGSGVVSGTMFDLQNLEVLKGPQGTLFGRNTDGGAVLLVPKKPTSDLEGYVQQADGNYGMESVQAVVNLPVNDFIRVRLGVNQEKRHGYLTNISGIGPSDFDDIDYTAARLSVVVDITPNIENYFVGTYNLTDTSGSLPQLFACNPNPATAEVLLFAGPNSCTSQLASVRAAGPYAVENDFPTAQSYLRQMTAVDTITWQANDNLTVKNIANYGQLLSSLTGSIFGTNFIGSDSNFPQLLGHPIIETGSDPGAAGALITDQYTASDELQLRGSALQDKFTWQGGVYFERSGPLGHPTGTLSPNFLTCTNIQALQCAGLGLVDHNLSAINYTDWAVFSQATYSILDNLELTGGARYTADTTKARFSEVDYGGNPPGVPFNTTPYCAGNAQTIAAQNETVAAGCVQRYTQKSHAPTGVVDLDYAPITDLMIYGKYSRGYRQGGVATFVADGFHVYDPEYENAFELGEKLTMHGPVPGIFNVALFYDSFTNQQMLAGFFGTAAQPSSGIVNAGKSRIYGAEVETSINPVKSLTVGLTYTYLTTKLLSLTQVKSADPQYNLPIEYPSVVGGPLPFSPKNKGSVYTTYKLPVPDSVGSISLSAIGTFTSGALASQASPLSYMTPYGLLNMNLAWSSIGGSSVDGELFVSNLTDRLYYTNKTQIYETPLGIESRFPGEPRMYGVRVTYRFGKQAK